MRGTLASSASQLIIHMWAVGTRVCNMIVCSMLHIKSNNMRPDYGRDLVAQGIAARITTVNTSVFYSVCCPTHTHVCVCIKQTYVCIRHTCVCIRHICVCIKHTCVYETHVCVYKTHICVCIRHTYVCV